MPVALALLSAVVYGTADFFGGLATRRAPAPVIVFLSQGVGLAVAVVLALVLGGDPTTTDLVWGAVGGLCGGTGLTFFYWGLAHGVMSRVAPTTAVTSASVPVVVGLATGERPGIVALAGIALAVPAIGLVAHEREDDRADPTGAGAAAHLSDGRSRGVRPLLAALAAGVGFGAFFIALDRTGDDAGLWPLVAARLASTGLYALVLVARHERRDLRAGARPVTFVAGALDMVANGIYLVATREGLLAVVAVVASLYPASTVLLARTVLHERFHRDQLVGFALAAAAVALIALG